LPTSHEPPRLAPPRSPLPPDRAGADELTPLSSERYAVRFTASKELKEKLELAWGLLRDARPSGDFAPIIERALDLRLADLFKRRFGKVRSGRARRSRAEQKKSAKSRHIANAARRDVAERDGIQCSWTDDTGRHCPSRPWLEFDWIEPGASRSATSRILSDRAPMRRH
jgi:hypothetical protein